MLAFGLAIAAFFSTSERLLARLDWALLILGTVLLGAWAATHLYYYPTYGTDEAAFVQGAAVKLLHGHNPYTQNLLPALNEYRVPIHLATYKLDGSIASNLAYPSLSFLIVVPAVLLTHGVGAVIAENAFFLAVEMILLFLFLPRIYRALSVAVVVGLVYLFEYTLGGVILTLWVPFMLTVAYRWSDIGRRGRLERGGVIRAVCLGLAASMSQLPWFTVPFLVLGLLRLRTAELGRRPGRLVVARFVGIAAATALLLNAPFIVWAPEAWLRDVVSPLVQHAVPLGQGVVDAAVFFRLGGGNLAYYTYAAAAFLVALLVAYSASFHRLWRLAFILPSAVFLFSTRPLSGYVIMLPAVWIVSLLRPGSGPREPPGAATDTVGRGRRGRPPAVVLALGSALTLCLLFVALALAASPPLTIRIDAVETNGQFQSIWRIRALVANRSHSRLEPHFATDVSGYITTFWNVVHGPRTLEPGQQAVYTLVAPNVGSMPGVTQSFVLHAVTPSPETISSSSLYTPQRFSAYLSPSYVNEVLPLGTSVTLKAELRSPDGAPVHRAGVRVALGQIIYGQDALIAGQAQINDGLEGQSPVFALTDRHGVATFRIRNRWVQDGNPLYFEAWVAPDGHYPYGYSEVVSVYWGQSDVTH